MWNTDVKYTRIKLCWFEYPEAAYEASFIGADTLGLHVLSYNTPLWRMKVARLQKIAELLPNHIGRTLLTDYPLRVVRSIVGILKVDSVQLYPDWPVEKVRRLRDQCPHDIKILKVMSAQPEENAIAEPQEFIEYYRDSVDAILLDSYRQGGTGKVADLDRCAEIVENSPLPVFLAGGLTPENVGDVIRRVRPFGVDVETGVSNKISEGVLLKDLGKCRRFVEEVMRVDREMLRERAKV